MYPQRISQCASISLALKNKVKNLGAKDWGSARANDFKKEIRSKMLAAQDSRCAYCGYYFYLAPGHSNHIEHIACKSKHSEWTFEPWNLVLSCPHCNMSECKGQENVVDLKTGDCKTSQYTIIHPYIDEFNDYINWELGSAPVVRTGISFPMNKKARQTIDMFKLNSDPKINLRNMSNDPNISQIENIVNYHP